ncbi:MAG TPA: hypothetical protein PLG17_02530 [Thermodesulfobacteriota bacterium]|nr:hypothetical protein [Thermodesulfobacteriota bacterium]HQO77370.1 hypothetical protein [Thermodesulfobacteriota bacterium]
MTTKTEHTEATEWRCFQCGASLEMRPVNIAYMEYSFPVNVPQCPQCGLVYISEELAIVKMAEVEKMLEDK